MSNAATTGWQTMRLYMGPQAICTGVNTYFYTQTVGDTCGSVTSLSGLAARADFQSLFNSTSINTFNYHRIQYCGNDERMDQLIDMVHFKAS